MASASRQVIVDSSRWIEYLADGPKAAEYAPYFEREDRLVVPAMIVYEVYRKLLHKPGQTAAEGFFSQALRLQSIDLDARLAAVAAHTSIEHRLPIADAIIYAAAWLVAAEVVTSDRHCHRLPGFTSILQDAAKPRFS